jgi:hypothetical protein
MPKPTKGEQCVTNLRKVLNGHRLVLGVRAAAEFILDELDRLNDPVRRPLVDSLHRKSSFLIGRNAIPEQHLQIRTGQDKAVRAWCDVNALAFKRRTASAMLALKKAAGSKTRVEADNHLRAAVEQLKGAEHEAGKCALTVVEFCGGAKNPARLREMRKGPPKKK